MSVTVTTSNNINIAVTRTAPLRLVLGHGAVVGDEGEPVVGHHGGQDGAAAKRTINTFIHFQSIKIFGYLQNQAYQKFISEGRSEDTGGADSKHEVEDDQGGEDGDTGGQEALPYRHHAANHEEQKANVSEPEAALEAHPDFNRPEPVFVVACLDWRNVDDDDRDGRNHVDKPRGGEDNGTVLDTWF